MSGLAFSECKRAQIVFLGLEAAQQAVNTTMKTLFQHKDKL